MRRFSTPVCIVLCLIFMIQSIAFAAELHPKPLQLSETQRKEFNTFFTAFVYLSPFERGQISDEEMIRFALSRIYRETGYGNLKRWDDLHWAASVQEVDEKAHKYFGKLVPTHRPFQSISLWKGIM